MITDAEIEQKMRDHGYDWYSAYLCCLLERELRFYTDALGLTRPKQ